MTHINENEPLSSLTHLAGALLSVAALTLLVVFAAQKSTPWHIVGFSIFGASLILLYLVSAVYHIVPSSSRAKTVFRRMDHSMIFVLIAGTYAPISLTALRGGWGWSILGIILGLAAIGIVLKATEVRMAAWVSTILYIIMGWLGLVALLPITKSIPLNGLLWLLAGGIFYTLGAAFFSLDNILPRRRWFGAHEIFHLFVIAGSFSHFWLMLRYVVYV